MKKSVNFIFFTLILMLFILPSIFPNPMNSTSDVIDNSSSINNEFVDISNQTNFEISNDSENDDLKDENVKVLDESSINKNLNLNDVDTKAKERYDEEVKRYRENRSGNSSSPWLNNISNFSYNMQYIVSIVISFTILAYMIYKTKRTKNN